MNRLEYHNLTLVWLHVFSLGESFGRSEQLARFRTEKTDGVRRMLFGAVEEPITVHGDKKRTADGVNLRVREYELPGFDVSARLKRSIENPRSKLKARVDVSAAVYFDHTAVVRYSMSVDDSCCDQSTLSTDDLILMAAFNIQPQSEASWLDRNNTLWGADDCMCNGVTIDDLGHMSGSVDGLSLREVQRHYKQFLVGEHEPMNSPDLYYTFLDVRDFTDCDATFRTMDRGTVISTVSDKMALEINGLLQLLPDEWHMGRQKWLTG